MQKESSLVDYLQKGKTATDFYYTNLNANCKKLSKKNEAVCYQKVCYFTRTTRSATSHLWQWPQFLMQDLNCLTSSLFPGHRKERKFSTDEEVKEAVDGWFGNIRENFFNHAACSFQLR